MFYIDEDAYTLLDDYLTNLSLTFSKDEDKEIASDIEARISEIFTERLADTRSEVLTKKDVTEVIDIIGRPEQMVDDEAPQSSDSSTPPPYEASSSYRDAPLLRKKFYRDSDDCVLGGVVSGLCHYMGWDVPLMRFILVILAFFFPVLILVYIVAWMIFPAAVTAQQKLEMNGVDVTVGNIGQAVKGHYNTTSASTSRSAGSVLGDIAGFIAKVGLAILALIAMPAALLSLVVVICCLIALVSLIFVAPSAVMDLIPYQVRMLSGDSWLDLGVTIVWSLVILLPSLALIWGAASLFIKSIRPSRGLITALIVMELIFIIIGIVLAVIGRF